MSDEKPNLQKEEREAIDRIARSRDGHLLHRYLRRELESVFDTLPAGALPHHNGRRSLARDLMRAMAQGIEDTSRGGRNDDPILAEQRQPVGIRRKPTVRDWLVDNDDELKQLHVNAGGPAEPKPGDD